MKVGARSGGRNAEEIPEFGGEPCRVRIESYLDT